MKTKFPLLVLGAALFVGGCVVQSLNPLFAEKDFFAQPGLVGTWVQRENNKVEGMWQFEEEGRQFKLTHSDEDGRKAVFKVAAGKLGTNVFLCSVLKELTPGTELNDLATVHVIPNYVFMRLRKSDAGWTLGLMNLEWLEKLLEENPKAVAHVMRPADEKNKIPLLTASTEELQKFVGKYGDDEKAFGNEIKLEPKK